MLLHHATEKVLGFFDNFNLETIVFTPIFLLVITGVAYQVDPVAVESTIMALIALSPIWLPFGLLVWTWISWMEYIRYKFWFKSEHVLLRIDLPPEVEKSPLAMELFFSSLWNTGGETTFIDRIFRGTSRPWYSLEIASNEGQISFYMYMRRSWKNVVEARLYGQFPEARMMEVPDYAFQIPADLEGYTVESTEFKKADTVQAIPILTYPQWELDKDTDSPNMKIDPITHTLEWMSTAGPGEYMWLQIIFRPRKYEEWHGFYLSGNAFVDPAHARIEEMLMAAAERAKKRGGPESKIEQLAARGPSLLTSGERDRVEAIEHSLSKLVFECGIRMLYIAKDEVFDAANSRVLSRFWDVLRYPDNNVLRVARGQSNFDYPWQDFNNIRQRYVMRQSLFFYKHRAYFNVPLEQPPVFLTTEELATLWHFPNSGVKTPGITRVPAKVAEAPANLPI